jgi:hypothetical protein
VADERLSSETESMVEQFARNNDEIIRNK